MSQGKLTAHIITSASQTGVTCGSCHSADPESIGLGWAQVTEFPTSSLRDSTVAGENHTLGITVPQTAVVLNVIPQINQETVKTQILGHHPHKAMNLRLWVWPRNLHLEEPAT